MDERELFHAEVGRYLKAVSADYPVGICTRCGSLRARHDVNPKESCPAGLIEQINQPSLKSDPHAWKAAATSGELEALLAKHFAMFKELSERASQLV